MLHGRDRRETDAGPFGRSPDGKPGLARRWMFFDILTDSGAETRSGLISPVPCRRERPVTVHRGVGVRQVRLSARAYMTAKATAASRRRSGPNGSLPFRDKPSAVHSVKRRGQRSMTIQCNTSRRNLNAVPQCERCRGPVRREVRVETDG